MSDQDFLKTMARASEERVLAARSKLSENALLRQAMATAPPPPLVPPLPLPAEAPTEAVTEVTRIGPGSNTTSPNRMVPVAGRPRAVCQRWTADAVAVDRAAVGALRGDEVHEKDCIPSADGFRAMQL